MPMQYSEIFHGCKNSNFQMKNCAQNIDCEYMLELASVSNEFPQSMFKSKNNIMYTPVKPQFYYISGV